MKFSWMHRCDEKARRALFCCIWAAKQSDTVEPLHILAGVQRQWPELINHEALKTSGLVLPHVPEDVYAEMRRVWEGDTKSGGQPEFGFDKAFSENSKKVVDAAKKIADQNSSEFIGLPHLLFGIVAESESFANAFQRAGLSEERVRELCREYAPSEDDRDFAEELRKHIPHSYRSGIGYDLHRLAPGRKLIIGGIEVPFDKGPVGHSDGDVLSHALCDALLGAACLGDIGTHFPDTDPKWKGASSLLFLEHTRKLLDEKSLRILHLDAVVILERPKLGPHFPAMRQALAKSLGISQEQINLKAKTNEGTGEIGRGEAIAAQTIATLEA